MVVDKGGVASGPTALSSGLVRQFYTHPVVVQMAKQGRDTFADFNEIVGGPRSFVESGWVLPVDEASYATARKGLDIQARVGVESRWVTPTELTHLVPG